MESIILNETASDLKIRRMANQILEHNFNEAAVMLVGIDSCGLQLAQALAKHILADSGSVVPVFSLKLNKQNPALSTIKSNINATQTENAVVIVVDDVQNTGRTMMYACAYFLSLNVKSIQSAVLIDRRHNTFPVRADYIGLSLATMLQDHVEVVETDKGFVALLK